MHPFLPLWGESVWVSISDIHQQPSNPSQLFHLRKPPLVKWRQTKEAPQLGSARLSSARQRHLVTFWSRLLPTDAAQQACDGARRRRLGDVRELPAQARPLPHAAVLTGGRQDVAGQQQQQQVCQRQRAESRQLPGGGRSLPQQKVRRVLDTETRPRLLPERETLAAVVLLLLCVWTTLGGNWVCLVQCSNDYKRNLMGGKGRAVHFFLFTNYISGIYISKILFRGDRYIFYSQTALW